MNTSFKLRSRLCLQFVKGPYAKHNLDRINYVMKIYRKLTKKINTNEEKVINRLKEHNIW